MQQLTFSGEISLTRTQTPLHLNSIFIVRRSLSSGRREKSCLSRGRKLEQEREGGERERTQSTTGKASLDDKKPSGGKVDR